jgi:succinate dehydrogenase / fumarate reductase membrane anchor subunit
MNLATKKWVFLKISSVILLPLMFWFIINFVNVYDNDYFEIVKFYLI